MVYVAFVGEVVDEAGKFVSAGVDDFNVHGETLDAGRPRCREGEIVVGECGVRAGAMSWFM